ncbi:MAG: aspartate kinase [SAR324 cluster bacterium]|nr:aspartate kinase [SAR324 cluster bacterium]
MKDLFVQKFGGTSIGQASRMQNVAAIVKSTLDSGAHVAVVLSAMSGKVKSEGTTSRLLEAADKAIHGGAYYRVIDLLEESHLIAVEEMITDPNQKQYLIAELHNDFQQLKSFLDAISVIGEISPRSNDVIVSQGEKLAARIFAALLNSLGIDAEFVNLENIIKAQFNDTGIEFCTYVQKEIALRIKACGVKVPVVTGFFGYVNGGILQSIGRGYTDFTAALLAAGCEAKELQIWKEVDGIYTTDPRKVPNARVLSHITPDEALELTYYGSEVIHPFTMEQVSRAGIPVRIKNTFAPEKPGTMIDPSAKPSIKAGPTAVTVKKGVTMLSISSNRMIMAYGFMTKVFNIFNKYEIIIDFISTSEINISMTMAENQELDAAIEELKELGSVSIKKDIAILSLVGGGMRHSIGIAGRMFTVLADAGVNIEAISQGASEINISCAISDEDGDKALKAVHTLIEE